MPGDCDDLPAAGCDRACRWCRQIANPAPFSMMSLAPGGRLVSLVLGKCRLSSSSVFSGKRPRYPTAKQKTAASEVPAAPKGSGSMEALLKRYGESDTKIGPVDPCEVGMFVKEDIVDAVRAEVQFARRQTDRAHIRRQMERGRHQPNVLSVAQKLQLRRLAAEQSDHWPPHRLAAAFHISTDAARKVLKSQWLPSSPEEIARHDAKVSARRRAQGLPAAAEVQSEPPPTATPQRPRTSLTALIGQFEPPAEPAPAPRQAAEPRSVSAIYPGRDVLQFPVSDTSHQAADMRRVGVPVNVSSKHMTLQELKRKKSTLEKKRALKDRGPKPVV